MRLSLAAGLALLTAGTAAQPAPADSARAAYVAVHLLPLDGLLDNVASGSGQRLLDAFDGARVVALGEPTHGDGAAFLVRSALTQLLHERAEFDVLALEAAGLTDALPLASPGEALARIDSVAPYVWASAREARAGLAYAASTAGTLHPLRTVGLDVIPQSGGSVLMERIERALSTAGALDARWPEVRRVLGAYTAFQRVPVSDSLQAEIEAAVAAYRTALHAAGDGLADHLLAGALASARQFWVQRSTPRDRQMGKNLAYLVCDVYPDSRAVVWAASSHAVRRLAAVDPLDEWSYDEAVTMGDVASASLGDAYRVVAFTACGGEWGAPALDLPDEPIPPPTPGSLEALVCAAPFEEAAFLDLRALAQTETGAWLYAPLLARPLGYGEMRASWPLVLDGLVVVREMTPATAVGE